MIRLTRGTCCDGMFTVFGQVLEMQSLNYLATETTRVSMLISQSLRTLEIDTQIFFCSSITISIFYLLFYSPVTSPNL